MSDAVLHVVRLGPHVSIQDAGRPGLMRFGVPASGPMDRGAFAAANAALGNPVGQAAIEVSLGGLALDCVEGAVTLAVAGGGFRVGIHGAEHGAWSVHTLHPGMRLTLRPGFWGSWTYIACAGRIEAERWLESVSTHGPTGLGGGRLQAGQSITVEDAQVLSPGEGDIPCPVTARPRSTVRVVLGPQDRFFAGETVAAFLSQPFVLTDAYDRMGVRLAGPSLRPNARLDMPSEPIMRGSIQVAGDGVATVLLADHQTTGGYPKIATVVSEDLDGFVQARSRHRVRFEAVTAEEAVSIARTRGAADRRYLERLSRTAAQGASR